MAHGGIGLEAGYRSAAITCGAIAASIVLYAVIVELISVSQAPFAGFASEGGLRWLRILLWANAALEVSLIGMMRRFLLARARAAGGAAQTGWFVTIAVVTAGLAEVPAVLGLVLFMFFGLRGDFYALCALSLAVQAAYFPRLDGWREWAAKPVPSC